MALNLRRAACATAFLFAIAGFAEVGASAHSIVKISVPGTKYVRFSSLNTQGTVLGYAQYSRKNWFAFIRTLDGAMTTYQYPGAISTYADDINAAGAAIGTYFLADKIQRGYIRAADGTFTSYDLPQQRNDTLFPIRINGDGVIAGSYTDGGSHAGVGYVRAPDGTLTFFNAPGARHTAVRDMNKDGVIVGDFLDTSNKTHGFVRLPDGTITQIDAPNSGFSETTITSINANGEMAGSYRANGELRFGHAFFRDAAGNFTFFSAGQGDTLTTSIDNDRDITGTLVTGDAMKGFVYRVGGGVTTFKIGAFPRNGVIPRRIINGGMIGGSLTVPKGKRTIGYAFLRIP